MLMHINNVVTKGKFSTNVQFSINHRPRSNEPIFDSFSLNSVVEFASLSDMKTAIEKLDDTELNGRRVRLVEDRRGGRSKNHFFLATIRLHSHSSLSQILNGNI